MALAPACGPLSDESKGVPFGEVIRDYEPAADAKWRGAVPDYSLVNKVYFEHRAKKHAADSLEALVTKIVKNFEVEIHNIGDIQHWKTVDTSKFRAAVSGGCPFSAQHLSDVGHTNMLLGDTPQYCSSYNTRESSTTIFTEAFSEGLAWEVLEVLAGPPNLTFKWRHFGKFTGVYTDRCGKRHKGSGKLVNLVGICIAKLNDQKVIETVDCYYNPDDLLKHLVTNVPPEEEEVPANCAEADAKQPSKSAPAGGAAKKPDACILM